MIDNIENTNTEYLETLTLRPLREIILHHFGISLLTDEQLNAALSKLKEIDDEIKTRRI